MKKSILTSILCICLGTVIIAGIRSQSGTIYDEPLTGAYTQPDTTWITYPSESVNYKIALVPLPNEVISSIDTPYNSVFILFEETADKTIIVSIDSIWSKGNVEFADYNNDNIKDLLIDHTSSARGNESYYLYLIPKSRKGLKKIRNFEKIPNPFFDSTNNVISNYVLTGTNYTDFYKISGDSVIDLHMTIEDIRPENDVNNTSHYDKEYAKAIGKIQRMNKKALRPK